MNTIIKGKLGLFSEQHTEGTVWSLYQENTDYYEGLNTLRHGDYLRVYRLDNSVLWEGNVVFDYTSQIPAGKKRQVIDHMTVHGVQEGVDAREWASWFIMALPAELLKSAMPRFYPISSSMISAYSMEITPDTLECDTVTMLIKFKDSSVYRYAGVPKSVVWGLETAVSPGRYFSDNIKNKYVSEKVMFPKMDPVPPVADTADYDEFLEWTPQEEEEFLKILNDTDTTAD